MVMNATVIQSDWQGLLVTDNSNGQEVRVWYRNANAFSPGDQVRITYSGQMTLSIPPQITARSVRVIGGATPPSTGTMTAVILSVSPGFLMVRNTQDQQQYRVDFSQAQHFCVGQQVTISYDTLTLSNPPRVTATQILPVC